MSSKNKPLIRTQDVVVQEHDGEVLIYDLNSNKAFCLNETSALIWYACDGSKDVSQISDFVGKRLNSEANEDLVWLALDQLKKEKLIENAPDSDGRFAGMSRRDVIKKVAVGTLIAVPIISGLVAPPAYAQGSGCVPCVCDTAGYTMDQICMTGMGGMACAGTAGCLVCHASAAIPSGSNGAGYCAAT